MAITMQGAWTVAVKSKSAAFAQRFIISNAASGNGTYAGDVATPPVFVTGDHWSISIQNAPTAGHWVDSADQITFPTVAAGKVQFDIQSNDAGADQDFNDLILTCSAPQTLTDFFLYGHVSYYDDFCIFNPCWRDWLVIETPVALANALKNPYLKVPIEKLYPLRKPALPPRPATRPAAVPAPGDPAARAGGAAGQAGAGVPHRAAGAADRRQGQGRRRGRSADLHVVAHRGAAAKLGRRHGRLRPPGRGRHRRSHLPAVHDRPAAGRGARLPAIRPHRGRTQRRRLHWDRQSRGSGRCGDGPQRQLHLPLQPLARRLPGGVQRRRRQRRESAGPDPARRDRAAARCDEAARLLLRERSLLER